MARRKSSTPPRNHFVDYLLTMLVVFALVVLMGFFFVEDIRLGLTLILQDIIESFAPGVLG